MDQERTNRLSPAGRLRCAESGRKNVRIALETRRAAVPALKAAITAFELSLRAEVGQTPTAVQRGLILAATASYTALFIVLEKLRVARRFKRIETLIDQVTPLQGALQRTLRALGVERAEVGDDPDSPPRGGIADYLAGKLRPEGESDDRD